MMRRNLERERLRLVLERSRLGLEKERAVVELAIAREDRAEQAEKWALQKSVLAKLDLQMDEILEDLTKANTLEEKAHLRETFAKCMSDTRLILGSDRALVGDSLRRSL